MLVNCTRKSVGHVRH